MNCQEKFKLIAFLSLVKNRQRNSIIFHKDGAVKTASKLGISYRTYCKYYEKCLQQGLFYESGKNTQAINLVCAIEKLGLTKVLSRFCNFTKDWETLSFHQLFDRIKKSVVLKNFVQQEFRIQKAKELKKIVYKAQSNRFLLEKKERLVLQRALRESGVSFKTFSKRVLESKPKSIVTGKKHAATLINASHSTGKRLLVSLVKDKTVTRRIVNEKLCDSKGNPIPYTNEGWDLLQAKKRKGMIVPSPRKKCFYFCPGSKIEILNYELVEEKRRIGKGSKGKLKAPLTPSQNTINQ